MTQRHVPDTDHTYAGDDTAAEHTPVMLAETVAALLPRPGGRYIDGTLGLGGHAAALLEAAGPDARLLGIDADPDARAVAAERLARFGDRVQIVAGNARDLARIARERHFDPVDGVLLDLGVSSLQFGPHGRGFTIRWDAPLDMRMDPAAPLSAADVVNTWPAQDLADVIFRFGEERHSRRIAAAIVRARPISTTTQLAGVVAGAAGKAEGRIHPATRTFQALRILVNDEAAALEEALAGAAAVLGPGGRLAVLAYHSGEDRIVKDFLRDATAGCRCPRSLPACVCGWVATFRTVTRGAARPSPDEVARNPRARSARLRVAERLGA